MLTSKSSLPYINQTKRTLPSYSTVGKIAAAATVIIGGITFGIYKRNTFVANAGQLHVYKLNPKWINGSFVVDVNKPLHDTGKMIKKENYYIICFSSNDLPVFNADQAAYFLYNFKIVFVNDITKDENNNCTVHYSYLNNTESYSPATPNINPNEKPIFFISHFPNWRITATHPGNNTEVEIGNFNDEIDQVFHEDDQTRGYMVADFWGNPPSIPIELTTQEEIFKIPGYTELTAGQKVGPDHYIQEDEDTFTNLK